MPLPAGESDGDRVALVSVIVVALGDDPDVPACLSALSGGTQVPLQIILVENAADGPAPTLPVDVAHRLRRKWNNGFTGGVEDALALATAPFVLSLNPDCQMLPGALEVALAALSESGEVGAIAFRLLRPDGQILDSAGIRLGFLNRPKDVGGGGPAHGMYLSRRFVDGACMAGALFRRAALLDARDGMGEVLDRSFFAYKEDADLGWRLRRAGYRILYEPTAVAIHRRGWREGMRHKIPVWLRVMSLRNRWLMILKNEPLWLLATKLAIYVPVELLLLAVLLLREPRVLRAYPEIFRHMRTTLSRRRLLKTIE